MNAPRPSSSSPDTGDLSAGRPTLAQTWARRAVTFPLYLVLWAGLAALLPGLLALGLLVDGLSRRTVLARFFLFVFVYLSLEVLGMARGALLFVRHPLGGERFLAKNFALQSWWAGSLLGAASALYRFRLYVTGQAEATPGPYVLLCRHVSVGDTLLPSAYVSRALGIQLRYVLKRELLWDPCLDIVGQRLPNAFVRRGKGRGEAELQKLRGLCHDLGPTDGVLSFPEGTRFSPAKRQRLLRRLADKGDEAGLVRATALTHTLPPRLLGTLALLETAKTDVVFCAHTGFEGLTRIGDLIRPSMMGRAIRIHFWRVAAQAVPSDEDARTAWLMEQWQRVDQFVADAGLLDDGETMPALGA